MSLLKHETIKILRSTALYVFIATCFIMNVFVVLTNSPTQTIDYLNTVGEVTGPLYGSHYIEQLEHVPVPGENDRNRWIYNEVVWAAHNAVNVFAQLDGGREIQRVLHEERMPYSGITVRIQQWKYDLLEPVIEQKAVNDDGASVYFGIFTPQIHHAVFNTIGTLVAMQGYVFFTLVMLWTLGFESMAGTGLVIWASKAGRRLAFHKIIAALLIGTCFFIINHIFTYSLTFTINDFSQVWSQNISAQYNSFLDAYFGMKDIPFITWSSMTVGGYFYASAGVALLNGIVAALFVIPFGLLIRNVYAAFSTVLGLNFFLFMFYMAGSAMGEVTPFIWSLCLITPLIQLGHTPIWFTDGGMLMLLPRFETLYPLIYVLLLCPIIIFSMHRFFRKEIY